MPLLGLVLADIRASVRLGLPQPLELPSQEGLAKPAPLLGLVHLLGLGLARLLVLVHLLWLVHLLGLARLLAPETK